MEKVCIIIIENEKPQSGCHENDNNHPPGKAEWLFFIAYVVNTR